MNKTKIDEFVKAWPKNDKEYKHWHLKKSTTNRHYILSHWGKRMINMTIREKLAAKTIAAILENQI